MDVDGVSRGGFDARRRRAKTSDAKNVWMSARASSVDGGDAMDVVGMENGANDAFCVKTYAGGDGESRSRTYEAEGDLGLSSCEHAAFVSDDACVVFSADGRGACVTDVFSTTTSSVKAIDSAFVEVKGANAKVTTCASTEAAADRACAVVGDSNGNLYAIGGDARSGSMSWTPFDRSNRSHWVDDMHSEEAGGGPSGLMSPTKTPGKNPWGALRSATKAASMILSRKVNAGGVRSLSFAEGSSDTKRRLLVCIADGTLEEWSIDVSDEGHAPVLAHAHRVSKQIQRALRVTSNIRFVSADWTVTESGVDITLLVTCDGQGSFHRFKRAHGTDQMELVASGVPPAGALPRDFERTRLRVEEESTFVLTNDGSAIMFSGVDYSSISARMDAANHEAIIDAKCGTGGEWLLLSNESGVSAFTPQSGGRQTTPRRSARVTPSKRVTRSSTKVDSPSVTQVDDSDAADCIRSEFEDYFAGHAGPPGQTKSRLHGSGAFVSASAPFATVSKGMVDALPKKLSGKSTRGGPTIEENGTEKMNRHLLFLEFLTESGVWNEINPEERSEILMHGEMIAALLQLRGLQNTVDDDISNMLEDIANHAGAAIKENDDALEERSDVEVFFSRSSEARLLFPAVNAILEEKLSKGKKLESRVVALDTCARGLLVALEAANDFRRRRTGMYPPASSVAGVSWSCDVEARETLRALADVSIKLHAEAVSSTTDVGLAPVIGSRLMAAAGPLLDACAANLNAALLGSTARIDAHKEYVDDRNLVLPALLTCAEHDPTVPLGERPQYGSLSEGVDVSIEAVAVVAEAHFGYAQLFAICDTNGGTDRLHHYMRTLLGAQEDDEESFSHFVYRKLAIEQDRDAALLRELPAEFHGDLERFLEPHPELRWLMELRVGKYAKASETLTAIGKRSGSNADETRRMLSMAKLAVLAAGGNVDERMNAIDASLSA